MSEIDGKKRPQSFIEDEQIEIKPSTELIPDEYERKDNENLLVELICRKDDEIADDLAKRLKKLGFSINTTYVDRLNINEDWINNFTASVNEKTKEKDYDGLLMIFAKIQLRNDVLKSIWGNFTASKCPGLKNKPKIFLFQIFKTGISRDTSKISLQTDIKTAYDTPSEADILIIYDKCSSDSSNDFLENFHEHIKEYGNQEDIINLVSLSMGSESCPLVISTMTRKFFFTVNQYRGHHHNINENHNEIKENLEEIMKFLKNIPDHKPKDKEKGILNSFRKTLNPFRNKNHQGKEPENDKNKAHESDKFKKLSEVKQEKQEKRVVGSKKEKPVVELKKEKPKPLPQPVEPLMPPPNKTPTRRPSTSSVPSTPTKKTATRTRYPSSSFSSKEDLAKKPPWR